MSTNKTKKTPAPIPTEVIDRIKSAIGGRTISDELSAILDRKYNATKRYQTARGVLFNLTLPEYLALISSAQMQNMELRLKKNGLKRFMKSEFGFVLTWKSKTAMHAKVMDATTAEFVNRVKSRRNVQNQKGETHTQKSKDAISAALKGVAKTAEHKANISAATKGVKRTAEARANISAGKTGRKQSQAQKDAIAEGQRRRHAERAAAKAAKENGNG